MKILETEKSDLSSRNAQPLTANPADFLSFLVHLVTLGAEPNVCPGRAEPAQVALIGLKHCDFINPVFTVITPYMGLSGLDPISDGASNIAEDTPW